MIARVYFENIGKLDPFGKRYSTVGTPGLDGH